MKYSKEFFLSATPDEVLVFDHPAMFHEICMKDNGGEEFLDFVGLLDTGADAIGIPESLFRPDSAATFIGMGQVPVLSATGKEMRTWYKVDVKLPGFEMAYKPVKAFVVPYPYFLIGRNVLNDFCLTADAPTGRFRLEV